MMMHHPILRRSHLMAGAAALALAASAPVSAQLVNLPENGTVRGSGSQVRFNYGTDLPAAPTNPASYTGAAVNANNAIQLPGGDVSAFDHLALLIQSRSAVIEWDSFNIGRSGADFGTVHFVNGTAGGVPFAVLNRVGGNSPSQIEGVLRGNSNDANGGSIWVVNPNGIVFGPRSSVTDMSSFVASTLSVDTDEFLDFVDGGQFSGDGASNNVSFGSDNGNNGNALRNIIRLQRGTAAPDGGDGARIENINGAVLLVARQIDMETDAAVGERPAITAGGHVGFVVAQRATIRLTQSSLVQITIDEGAVLAQGDAQLIAGGTVSGRRVYAAVASEEAITANLLNVSGTITATTAENTDQGIVLRAGVGTGSVPAGDVTITMPGSNNEARGIGTAGLLTSSRGINISANGALAVASMNANGGNLTLSGDGVTVATGAVLTASGNVSVTDTGSTGITTSAVGAATFTANSDNASGGTLTLTTDGSIGAADRLFTLNAGNAAGAGNGDAIAATPGDGGSVFLGAVTGGGLTIRRTSGSIAGITTGDVLAFNNGIRLEASALTVGALAARQDIRLTTPAALILSTVRAGGAITLDGTPASVSASRIEANGAISITTPGQLEITTAGGLATRQNDLNAGLTAFDVAATRQGNISLTADTYAIAADGGTNTRDIVSTGDLTLVRNVAGVLDLGEFKLVAGQDLSLTNNDGLNFDAGPGSYGFARSLTLNGAVRVGRLLTLEASDAAATGTATFANDVTLASGGALILEAGNINLKNIVNEIGSGAVRLRATADNGTLVVGNVATRNSLTLAATGTGGQITLSGATTLQAAATVSIIGPVSINNGLTIEGASVTLDNVVTRTTGANAGTGDVSITGLTGDVEAGTIASRGGLTVAADTGASTVTLAGATAAQGVLVTAGGAATIEGAVVTDSDNNDSTSQYVVRAASVTVGKAGAPALTQTGDAGVLLQANAGPVTFLDSVTLAANGGNLVIDAGAAAIVGTATTNLRNTGGAVLLRRDTATALTLGNITADNLASGQRNAPGLLPADYAAVAGPFTAGANLTLGTLDIGAPIDIAATAGNIVLNGAISTGAVRIVANAGSLIVGRTGSADAVNSGGNGNVTLRSDTGSTSVRAAINAGTGAVAINAATDVTLGRAAAVTQQGGTIAVTAGNRIIGNDAITLQSSQAGGISLTAGAPVPPGARSIAFGNSSVIRANGGGAVAITANAGFDGLALGSVTGGSFTSSATVPGAVDIRSLTIANGFSLTSGGAMAIGSARSSADNGSISLISGGNLVLGEAVLTGNTSALTLRAPAPGASISVTATPTVNGELLNGLGANLAATGDVVVYSSGSIGIASSVITTGANLTLDAGTTLTVGGDTRSRGRVVAVGNDVDLKFVESRNDIVLVARTGDLKAGDMKIDTPNVDDDSAPLDANGGLIVDPTNPPATIGVLTGKNIIVRAFNEATVGNPIGATLNAVSQVLNLGNKNVDVAITGTARRITGGSLRTTAEIVLNSTGTSDAGPNPDGIFVDSLDAGLLVSLTAARDIVVQEGITAGGAVTLTAVNGLAKIGGAVSAGGANDYIVRAGRIEVGTAGQEFTQAAGGGVLLQSLNATTGSVTALGALTLQSGTGKTVVDAATLISGAPALTAGTDVARTDALVRQGAAAPLALGNVRAARLLGTVTPAVPAPANYVGVGTSLANAGPISLGIIDVSGDLVISNLGSGENISIEGAVSRTGRVDIDAGLDLLIGVTQEPRIFSAGGTDMVLRAQRSILGSGTITMTAPQLTLTAGSIAPNAGPSPISDKSINLGGVTVTTTGASNIVASSTNFSGLTIGNVTAGSIGTSGVRGPIVARALSSVSSLNLTSIGGDISVVQATVTGTGQSLTIESSGKLAVGATKALGDVRLSALGGQLSVTGTADAGQDLVLSASGAVVTQNQLIAGRDLLVSAGGVVSLRWVDSSPVPTLQSRAGRDAQVQGTSVEVRQIQAAGDIVLTATNGDVLIPQFVGAGSAGARRDMIASSGSIRLGSSTPIGPAVEFPIDPRDPANPTNPADPINPGPGYVGIPTPPPPEFTPPTDLNCGAANCSLIGGDIVLGDIGGTGSLSINADSIRANDVEFTFDIDMISRDFINLNRVEAGRRLDLDARGSILVKRDSKGGSLEMTADDDISLGADLAPGALSAETTTNAALLLDAGQNLVAATDIEGLGNVTLKGGTLGTLSTAPDVDLKNVKAGGDLEIAGRLGVITQALEAGGKTGVSTVDGNVKTGTITAAAILATANNGTLDTGTLKATPVAGQPALDGSIALTATGTAGDILLAGVDAATRLTLKAGRDIIVGGPIVMTGNANFDAAKKVDTGSNSITLGAAGNLDVLARDGSVTLGAVNGKDITVTATAGKLLAGRLDGAAIKLTATGTAGEIELLADAGQSVGKATSLTMTADQAINTAGGLVSSGFVTLDSGSTMTIGTGLQPTDAAITATGGKTLLTADTSVEVKGAITAGSQLVEIFAPAVTTQAISAGSIKIEGVTSVGTGGLGAGNIDVRATGATGTISIAEINGGTVLVQANGNVTVVGDITTTDDAVTIQAGQIGTTASAAGGNLKVRDVTTGTGAITLLASNGALETGLLSGGDISVTATRPPGADADSMQGDILMKVAGGLSASATGGITLRSGRTATIEGGLRSGAAVDLQAGLNLIVGSTLNPADVAIGTTGAAGAVRLAAAELVDVKAAIEAPGRAVTISANDVVTKAISTGVGGSIAITGINSVLTGNLNARTNIDVRATNGTVRIANILDSGPVLVQASGNVQVDDVTTEAANGPVTIRAGQIGTTPGNGSGNLTVGAVTTGTGAITLLAKDGKLTTGALSGGAVSLTATGAAGDVTLEQVRKASSLTVLADNNITANSNIDISGAIDLDAKKAIDLKGVVNAASLKAVAGTTLTSTGNIDVVGRVELVGGTGLDVRDVNSRDNAVITLTATKGALKSGALSGGAIDATAREGTLSVASVSRSTAFTAQALSGSTVGDVTSTGGVIVRSGQIGETAGTGSGNLEVGKIDAGNGAITLRANSGTVTAKGTLAGGPVNIAASGANGDVALVGITKATTVTVDAGKAFTNTGVITATGAVTLKAAAALDQQGAVGTTGKVEASGTSVKMANVNAGAAGDIALTASTGAVQTGTLTGAAITLKSTAANVAIGGVADATSLAVEAATAVVASGAMTVRGNASFTTNRFDLTGTGTTLNVGSNAVLVKANASPADPVNIALGTNGEAATNLIDATDMAGVTAGSVQIDGNARKVVMGTATLFANGGHVGVRTTNDIDVNGVLTFAPASGPARTLTLGGDAVSANGTGPADAGLATQARNIVVRITQPASGNVTGGQIVATGQVVRLNGQRVAVGVPTRFLDTLPFPASPSGTEVATVRTSFTENPSSAFYQATPPYSPVSYTSLKADRLVLRVQQWGLVQNTDVAAQPGGGVDLSSVRLFKATGAPADGPIVGFFGKLGGQDGIAAALRLNIEDLGGITPNNVRINGCVALTTAGCIVTGLPLPLVQINDPGRGLLIRNVPDLILPLELISGTTNEALWRDDEELAPAVPTPAPAANPPRNGAGLP